MQRYGQIAAQAREQGADRPADDANSIDTLGAVTIEQAACRELRAHIGPTECGEQVSEVQWIKMKVASSDLQGSDGENHAISITEGAGDKQHEHDEVANVAGLFFRHRVGQGIGALSCGLR